MECAVIPRNQMTAVIGFTVLFILEIVFFFVIKKRTAIKKSGRKVRFLFTIAFVLIWIITLKLIIFPPAGEIPTTGEYRFVSEDYWVTEEVTDPYTNDGLRQLQVRKWSPVDCNDDHPVIVASHGSCGTIDNNVSLYRELASHGYIVLAVGHPGQAFRVTYENGKSAGPSRTFLKQVSAAEPNKDPDYALSVFREWMNIRTTDLNAVMDDYLIHNENAKFIMIGHSLGGSAAYAMARIRDDVAGCIALESPFMYDITGIENGSFVFDESPYNVPLLNIYSDSGYPFLREWKQYGNNVRFLEADGCTNIYYEGTGHMGLCDLSLTSPLIASILDGRLQTKDAGTQLMRLNRDCINWIEGLTDQN